MQSPGRPEISGIIPNSMFAPIGLAQRAFCRGWSPLFDNIWFQAGINDLGPLAPVARDQCSGEAEFDPDREVACQIVVDISKINLRLFAVVARLEEANNGAIHAIITSEEALDAGATYQSLEEGMFLTSVFGDQEGPRSRVSYPVPCSRQHS